MNVDPAVIVGLSGLVPYGSDAVGLPLTVGSRISRFGPAARLSRPSRMPPGSPTSSSAARTVSVASANESSLGNNRPKSLPLRGAPRPPAPVRRRRTGQAARHLRQRRPRHLQARGGATVRHVVADRSSLPSLGSAGRTARLLGVAPRRSRPATTAVWRLQWHSPSGCEV